MNKSLVVSIACFAFAATMSACSGGNSISTNGKQCVSNFSNPVSMKPGKNQKVVSLKPDEAPDGETLLPAGKYSYDHADIYYHDNSGLQIFMQDAKQADGTFKATINCVSGANANVHQKNMTIVSEGVSGMTVTADHKATVSTKKYGFMITNTRFVVSADASTDQTDSPDKVYNQKGVDALMFQTGTNSYAIQSSVPAPDGRGEYYISIYLNRSDL